MRTSFAPLLYGTWLLRHTNDPQVGKGMNYLLIQDVNTVKFKTLTSQEKWIGVKKSRTAIVHMLEQEKSNNTYTIGFQYQKKNVYTYSFLGIEIPEVQTESMEYRDEKNLTVQVKERILLVEDHASSLYYVFDLYLGNIRYPHIETTWSTFLFTQLFGILIGILINKLL